MQYRRLGRSGLQLSEIGLGSWLTYGNAVELETARKCHHKAFDLGINFFDTANVYATGEAERCLSKILPDFPRDEYVLATKCYFAMGEKPNQRGLSRKHIREQCDLSLQRLGVDYVDLYQCHRYDENTPLDETLRALDDLVRAGKVLYVGVSEWPAHRIVEAHRIAERLGLDRIVSNQPCYNMLRRQIERAVIPICEHLGVGQVVYSPLGQGVLTGKYSGGKIPPDSRAADDRQNQFIKGYLRPENIEKADKLKPVAEEAGLSLPQLAVAWCLRLPNVTTAIVGASRPQQVQENAAAGGVQLSDELLAKIDAILA
jgi:aryl-alcohol dehydrogenase-like predicted oxidoreductase